MTLTLQRGINIGGWLSGGDRRGAERAGYFNESDVRLIARLGFDHLRIPLDPAQLWDAAARRAPEAFSLLDAALDWSEQYGLRVVAALEYKRSAAHSGPREDNLWSEDRHSFEPTLSQNPYPDEADDIPRQLSAPLWSDERWSDLASFLCRRPPAQVVYDLGDWPTVSQILAMRKSEPERTLIIGLGAGASQVADWQKRLPAVDRNILLSFRVFAALAESGEAGEGQPFKRFIEALTEDIARYVTVAQAAGYPLYCAGLGITSEANGLGRDSMDWLRAVRVLLNEHNSGWCWADYKDGPAPLILAGEPSEVAEVLIG